MKTMPSLLLCGALLLAVSTASHGTPATRPQESSIGVGGGGAVVGRYALIAASLPDRDLVLRLDTMTGATMVAEGSKWVPFIEGVRASPKGVPGALSLTVHVGPARQAIYLLNTCNGDTWTREGSKWSPFRQGE